MNPATNQIQRINGTAFIRRTKAQGNAMRKRKRPALTLESRTLRKPETRVSLFRDACNERGRGLC